LVPLDGAAVEARGRAGLEAAGAEAEGAEGLAQQDRGGFAAASGGIALFAAVDEPVEKGAGGDDGGAGEEVAAIAELEADDAAGDASWLGWSIPGLRIETGGTQILFFWSQFPVSCSLFPVLEDEIHDLGLADVEAGLGFENFAHLDAIELLVALGARAPDSRAARCIEEAELDADGIGDFAHDAAESVDFADQVTLGNAADGRVAAHLSDQVEVHGDERGLEAHARGSHCGFAAGVACADYGDIVLFSKSHLEKGKKPCSSILRILR